jgi:hypothetical protein
LPVGTLLPPTGERRMEKVAIDEVDIELSPLGARVP